MKKIFVVVMGVCLLLIAAIAFARPWGPPRQGAAISAEQQRFFDETRELRKEMHDRRFELMELSRNPETDTVRIEKLQNAIDDLQARIRTKAAEFNIQGGPGGCANGGNCRGQGYAGCTDSLNCREYASNEGCANCPQGRMCGPQGRMMNR